MDKQRNLHIECGHVRYLLRLGTHTKKDRNLGFEYGIVELSKSRRQNQIAFT